MPSDLSHTGTLKHKFLKYTPKKNHQKIKKVFEMERDKANVSFKPDGAGEG